MLNLTQDIHSLTDFKRNTPEHLERLKASGRPEVLTVNGKAEVVVQDAESYQRMLDELQQAETTAQISRAIKRLSEGEKGKPVRQFLEELASESGFKLTKKA